MPCGFDPVNPTFFLVLARLKHRSVEARLGPVPDLTREERCQLFSDGPKPFHAESVQEGLQFDTKTGTGELHVPLPAAE